MSKKPDVVADALVEVLTEALARTCDEGLMRVLLRLVDVGDERMREASRVLGDVAPTTADASRAKAHLGDAVRAAEARLHVLRDAYGRVARLEEEGLARMR